MHNRNNGFRIVPAPGERLRSSSLFAPADLKDEDFRLRSLELSKILNLMPVGILIIDPESYVILDVNNYALKLIGCERDSVVGAACQSFLCSAQPGECPLAGPSAATDGEAALLTVGDGALFVIKTITSIEYRGRTALLESIVDVSQQKRAEMSVKEREKAFAIMASAAQDAIIAVNQEGRVFFWNRAAERIFGYSARQVIGKDIHALLVPDEYRDTMQDAFRRWQQSGEGAAVGKTVELTACNNSQTTFPVELSLSSVFFNDQWNAIAMIRDITERKRAESELQKNSQHMSQWIAELEQANLEMNLLRQMGDLLQACNALEEAYQVVGRYGPSFFPSSAGCLYVYNDNHKSMELAVSWGTVSHSDYFFHIDQCWALRRNRLHASESGDPGFRCKHLEKGFEGAYLDVPIILSGELLGLVYVELPSASGISERARKMLPVVAEHLALSFSNLKLRERLREQSIRDPLTGLFNRRYMKETLDRELHRASRHNEPLSVVMLDIDDFKRINDTYGHDAGDGVLKEVSSRITGVIRGSDFACRLGGEEFIIVMPAVALDRAGRRAEELCETVGRFPFMYNDCNLGLITVSLGVAVYPEHGSSAGQLMIEADRALYLAKNEGKNRVAMAYNP